MIGLAATPSASKVVHADGLILFVAFLAFAAALLGIQLILGTGDGTPLDAGQISIGP